MDVNGMNFKDFEALSKVSNVRRMFSTYHWGLLVKVAEGHPLTIREKNQLRSKNLMDKSFNLTLMGRTVVSKILRKKEKRVKKPAKKLFKWEVPND